MIAHIGDPNDSAGRQSALQLLIDLPPPLNLIPDKDS